MLGKIEGRRRGQQQMRWLNGITDSMNMTMSSLVCCSPWGHSQKRLSDWTTIFDRMTGIFSFVFVYQTLLYYSKYSWVLFLDAVKLLGNSLTIVIHLSPVSEELLSFTAWYLVSGEPLFLSILSRFSLVSEKRLCKSSPCYYIFVGHRYLLIPFPLFFCISFSFSSSIF